MNKQFEKVKKVLGLKRTDFVVDITQGSWCNTDVEPIICYIENKKDAIHEGVHAYFDERGEDIFNKVDIDKYTVEDGAITDEHLEEATARIIETNYNKINLPICSKDTQKTIDFVSKNNPYSNKQLGKNIMRIYSSIYSYNCISKEDISIYNKLKNRTNPKEVYNILADHVGLSKLI